MVTHKHQRQLRSVSVDIFKRKEDSTLCKISFEGWVTEVIGDPDEVATMMLEAETYGNDGPARIHISVRG